MSMREYPSSGYTVPLKSLRAILPLAQHQAFDELMEKLEDGDIDGEEVVAEFLSNNLTDKFPAFTVYRVSDEDTPDEDNMECGEYYAIFDEADLYIKTEKPEYTAMKKLGVDPKFSCWSVWG